MSNKLKFLFEYINPVISVYLTAGLYLDMPGWQTGILLYLAVGITAMTLTKAQYWAVDDHKLMDFLRTLASWPALLVEMPLYLWVFHRMCLQCPPLAERQLAERDHYIVRCLTGRVALKKHGLKHFLDPSRLR